MSNPSNDMSELSEILRLAVNSNKATTTEHQTAFVSINYSLQVKVK